MPSKRFHKLDPAKQRRILDAAAEEFAAAGFEGASYNRIIERSGVSKGAMYYYFEDKADLYATVVGEAVGAMMAGVGSFDAVHTPEEYWEEIARQFQGAFEIYTHNATMVGLFRQLLRDAMTGVGAEIMGNVRVEVGQWADGLVHEGQRVGAVRTDLPDSLLVSLVMGLGEAHDIWLAEHIDSLEEGELDRLMPVMVDLYRRLLSPAA